MGRKFAERRTGGHCSVRVMSHVLAVVLLLCAGAPCVKCSTEVRSSVVDRCVDAGAPHRVPSDSGNYHLPAHLAKIVNGQTAEKGQFPWQVSIRAALGRSVTVCGGSLIDAQWILTAAHCAHDYTVFQVGLGSIHLNVPRLTMSTVTKHVHPEFDPWRLTNDVALIRLPSPVPYSHEIYPIKLPINIPSQESFVGLKTIVSGFGRTSDAVQSISTMLKYEYMRIISNAECSTVYGASIIRNTTLCALGFDRSNQNVCQGDSGGPMVLQQTDGSWVQIGIVSFVSSRGCSTGDPSGYIRTVNYLDWIARTTALRTVGSVVKH